MLAAFKMPPPWFLPVGWSMGWGSPWWYGTYYPPICLRAADFPHGLPWQLSSEAKMNIFHWANCQLGAIQTCANWQMMCFQSSLWKLIEMKAGLWTFHLEACFIVVRHAQVYETEYRKALELKKMQKYILYAPNFHTLFEQQSSILYMVTADYSLPWDTQDMSYKADIS